MDIEAAPHPLRPGEMLDIELTVTNPSAFERPGVTLRLPYPGSELDRLDELATSDGATASAPTADLDGDGYANLYELMGGSDPSDPGDTPEDPSCSGTESTISSRSYGSGEWVLCRAGVELLAGGAVTVNAGATVLYVAPSVRLSPGFSVRAGGDFSAGTALP